MSESTSLAPGKGGSTTNEVVDAILNEANAPINVETVIALYLQRFKSTAKNVRKSARNKLRERIGHSLVFLDDETVAPLAWAMQGVGFRLPLDDLPLKQGKLPFALFDGYLFTSPTARQTTIHLVDPSDTPLSLPVVEVKDALAEMGVLGVLSHWNPNSVAFNLKDWLKQQRATSKDSLVLTVVDYASKTARIEIERASQMRADDIEQVNQRLADALYDMLEKAADETIYTHTAVPTALARVVRGVYAGNHWLDVIAVDERMTFDGMRIRYADGGPVTLAELLFADDDTFAVPMGAQYRDITREEGRMMHRFSAESRYGRSKPHIVEVKGSDTFADLDEKLRAAFHLDTFDHLGGFWKLVPRGTRRTREVNIGVVPPPAFRGDPVDDDASDIAIAALDLNVGDRVKYVYDFGDWLEHVLALEAIEWPQGTA